MASLVYQDAQQTLHAAEIVSLERAVLNCCRWGVPSVGSVLAVLDQVFAELIDHWIYASLGEADLLLGKISEAKTWYERAVFIGDAAGIHQCVLDEMPPRLVTRRALEQWITLEEGCELLRIVV